MNQTASSASVNNAADSRERAVIVRTIGLVKSYGSGEATTYALRGIELSIYR
jgi:hypothetical protein